MNYISSSSKIEKKNTKNFFFAFILLLFEYFNSFCRACSIIDTGISVNIRKAVFLMYFLFLLLSIIKHMRSILFPRRFVVSLFMFLYFIIIYFLKLNVFDITALMNIVMIAIIAVVGYMNVIPNDRTLLDVIVSIYIAIMAVMYMAQVINGKYVSQSAAINAIYYVVVLLPYVLIMRNKLLKILGSIIIVLISLVSLKSTAILLVIVVALLFYFSNKKRVSIKTFTLPIVLIIVYVIVSLFLSYFYDIDIYKTFVLANLQDGGNGRVDIWTDVIRRFQNNSIFEKIFGVGYEGVSKTSAMMFNYSAHNDFLEILFDYGIVGLVFFLLTIFELIKELIKMYKCKYEFRVLYAALLLESLILFAFSNALFQSGGLLIVVFLMFSGIKASYSTLEDSKE